MRRDFMQHETDADGIEIAVGQSVVFRDALPPMDARMPARCESEQVRRWFQCPDFGNAYLTHGCCQIPGTTADIHSAFRVPQTFGDLRTALAHMAQHGAFETTHVTAR